MNKNFIQQIKCLFIILFISCFCLSTWGGGTARPEPQADIEVPRRRHGADYE